MSQKPVAPSAGFLTAALMLLLAFSGCASASKAIRIDHGARAVKHGDRALRSGATISVRSPFKVNVELANSNTALYACTVVQESVPAPQLATVQAFLTAFGPYIPDVAQTRTQVDINPRTDDERAALNQLVELDTLLYGRNGMYSVHQTALKSLQQMRDTVETPDSVAKVLLHTLKSQKACDGNCAELTVVPMLLDVFSRLIDTRNSLSSATDSAGTALRAAVGEALAEREAIISSAYALEKLVARTAHATATAPCDSVQMDWRSGRNLKLRVAAHADPEIARIAAREPFDFTLRADPEWFFRPGLSLSLLYAPGQRYPEFGARTTEGTLTVAEVGEADHRWTYGLTLGTTFPSLSRNDWTLWVPELTVNPSSDVKALGIGAGLSWKILKLGAGHLWTRHEALHDLELNQAIASEDDIGTRTTYSTSDSNWGGFYLSLSVVGWPPFLPGSPSSGAD